MQFSRNNACVIIKTALASEELCYLICPATAASLCFPNIPPIAQWPQYFPYQNVLLLWQSAAHPHLPSSTHPSYFCRKHPPNS